MAEPPQWLQELSNAVAIQMTPVDFLAPIGCHFCLADGVWEIALFAGRTEVVGGRKDGVFCPSRFSVDVQGVVQLFDHVDSLHWQALTPGDSDELGAHLALSGQIQGENVLLRILAKPPRRFRTGRRAFAYERSWEDVW